MKQNFHILCIAGYKEECYMRRVWGFAFFWFSVGMIAGNLADGFLDFIILLCALVIAYVLFCK